MLLTQPETNNRKTSAAADTDRGGKDNEPSGRSTYLRILKSSAMVGGSSLVNIAMGVVRTKAMAVLLGPSGFGLAGLYLSIATLAQSIAGMGVNSSGVRQIAEATGTNDKQRIAITAAVLRKTSIWLGAVGGILLILFSRQVSTFTFGTDQHTRGVSILALSVFLNVIAAGQGALIQGLRRISDLTRISVWGALGGTLVTIPMIYFLHERGVVL